MRKLILTIFLLSFFFLIHETKAVLYINDCWKLDQPVEYVLTTDIIDHVGTCMNITVDNVTLNCNGHKIDGVGTTDYFGIYLLYFYPRAPYYVTIKNCIISDWYAGIYVGYYARYWKFTNNKFINLNYPVLTGGTYFNELGNSEFKNVSGVYYINVDLVENTSFFNNTITDSYLTHDGFYIRGKYNRIYNNTFKNCRGIMIELLASDPNYVFKNFFNITPDSSYIIPEASYRIAYLNDTEKGNYWGKTDGTGFSDICSDLDQNGICDDKYILWTNGIDYLPISRYGLPPPTPPIPTCGNGICDIGENYYNCPQDCKTPPSTPVPTTGCMVCNYKLLSPRDPIQNFYIGLCLIANLIVCNGLYLVIFVLFMLFLYFLKEWRKKSF